MTIAMQSRMFFTTRTARTSAGSGTGPKLRTCTTARFAKTRVGACHSTAAAPLHSRALPHDAVPLTHLVPVNGGLNAVLLGLVPQLLAGQVALHTRTSTRPQHVPVIAAPLLPLNLNRGPLRPASASARHRPLREQRRGGMNPEPRRAAHLCVVRDRRGGHLAARDDGHEPHLRARERWARSLTCCSPTPANQGTWAWALADRRKLSTRARTCPVTLRASCAATSIAKATAYTSQ